MPLQIYEKLNCRWVFIFWYILALLEILVYNKIKITCMIIYT